MKNKWNKIHLINFIYIFLYMCAIMFKKKARWSFLIRKIDWKVYSNNKLIIDNNNVKCNLYSSNIIEFKDEYGKHIIDLENKTYSKVGNDNKMVIDFIAKTCEFIFEKNGSLKMWKLDHPYQILNDLDFISIIKNNSSLLQ